ncbi:hypothetical protein PAV_15c00870 [Paenibacillus alvei DSM 29]|nr:hypothetical protein PAV_15c00870 [Paenibacillus alvei DSM 29]
MNELNERHKAFADYYIENQNGTESYKKLTRTAKRIRQQELMLASC